MKQFDYSRPASIEDAVRRLGKREPGRYLAGGTNLLDLMKMGVVVTDRLVDLGALPLRAISEEAGMLRIGAMATNADVADHPLVKSKYPLLSQAILAGASPQLRNMATTGGNLLQRTRCPYFFDISMPCNKRAPGSGCGALGGFNRMHAIFGASGKCIAVNPSDMSVALAALEAIVDVQGPAGSRSIAFPDFHRLPGDRPEQDTSLAAGELITGIRIPALAGAYRSAYVKVRDRSSYAFALVSAGVALRLRGRVVEDVRIAMGGVAHKPWRLPEVEAAIRGKEISESLFGSAAALMLDKAKAYEHNRFKLKLAPNTVQLALMQASGLD